MFGLDNMSLNNANFFRFEINLIDGLSLIGWDFVTNKNYCKFYNQRDSWQLDKILEYAKSKDMNMLMSVFAHCYLGDNGIISGYHDFNGIIHNYDKVNSTGDTIDGYCNGAWSLFHPYNEKISINHKPLYPDSGLDLQNPYEWYSKPSAIQQQKYLLRYIQARWGYATNLIGYELMDEADRIDAMNSNDLHPNYVVKPNGFEQNIINWHVDMTNYIRNIDNYHHLITTAYADIHHSTKNDVFSLMDFTQIHCYTNYDDIIWRNGQDNYYEWINNYYNTFNSPTMIGEHNYIEYGHIPFEDPHLYNLQDNLWSTFHNGSMAPASFWTQYNISLQNATSVYKGIGTYAKQFPLLSENHNPLVINGSAFRIYYLQDINSDEFYGWIQDVNFTFKNLFENYPNYLQTLANTDRPPLSSQSNNINFTVSRNGIYKIKWYNTMTGEVNNEQLASATNNQITLTMPIALRQGIHGDAAFIVEYQCESHWNTSVLHANAPKNVRYNSPLVVSNNNQVNYIGDDNRIHQMYWYNGFYWFHAVLNANAPQNVHPESSLVMDQYNDVYFVGIDNRVHIMYWNNTYWQEAVLNASALKNVHNKSALVIDQIGDVYFIGLDHLLHSWSSPLLIGLSYRMLCKGNKY